MRPLAGRVVVVVPCFEARGTIVAAVSSILAQDAPVDIVVRDDSIGAETGQVLAGWVGVPAGPAWRVEIGPHSLSFVRNSRRLFPAGAIYETVLDLVPDDATVIAVVDGDDRLVARDAVSRLLDAYERPESPWVVWSQHRTVSGAPGCSGPLPLDPQRLRERMYWCRSHFRSAVAGLYRRVRQEDLLDPWSGGYTRVGGDAALGFPLLEMAGPSRCVFVDRVLYEYDDTAPGSERATQKDLVERYSWWIRREGARYQPLPGLALR